MGVFLCLYVLPTRQTNEPLQIPSYPPSRRQAAFSQPVHTNRTGWPCCLLFVFRLDPASLRFSRLGGRATPAEASGSKDGSAAPPGENPTTFIDRGHSGRGGSGKSMDRCQTVDPKRKKDGRTSDRICISGDTQIAQSKPQNRNTWGTN